MTDEEKRKYFAIQANHYAGAPPGAKYNQERINKEKSDLRVSGHLTLVECFASKFHYRLYPDSKDEGS